MYLLCGDRSKPFGFGVRTAADGQSERILMAGTTPCLFAPEYLLVFHFLVVSCIWLAQTNPAFGVEYDRI